MTPSTLHRTSLSLSVAVVLVMSVDPVFAVACESPVVDSRIFHRCLSRYQSGFLHCIVHLRPFYEANRGVLESTGQGTGFHLHSHVQGISHGSCLVSPDAKPHLFIWQCVSEMILSKEVQHRQRIVTRVG